MALTYCPDTTPADWVVASGTPAMQLINFGPACFAAYARLRFVPDPAVPGQAEADVALPDGHPSDIAQARCALKVLAGYAATADDCYFCLWEGYSDAPLPAAARGGPLVETPYRRYALLRGSLADIDRWEADLGGGQPIAPPAFVWPADRRWCFASDVDPHWAGIGGAQSAIDALVGDPRLDAVPACPTRRQPHYR